MAESAGVRLKKLRLEKGLSLEEVHKKTKIHLNILKSIEEDNLINLNPVYIKGFLKIYCKFLNVDPADFISDYKESKPQAPFKPAIETKTQVFFKNFSLRLGQWKPRVSIKRLGLILLIIFFVFALFQLAKFISFKRHNLTQKKKPQAVMLHSSQQSPSLIRLGMRAKDNCFIRLKIDGKLVFQAVLKKGRFEAWQAKEKIEFSVSNAGAVELEVNGKVISSLGRKTEAIRSILVTKEGLSIRR